MDREHEFNEALAELDRHHKDFAQISEIVHEALAEQPWTRGCSEQCGQAARYEKALRKIRRIVG